jgi:flagellar hook-length control protein FliK
MNGQSLFSTSASGVRGMPDIIPSPSLKKGGAKDSPHRPEDGFHLHLNPREALAPSSQLRASKAAIKTAPRELHSSFAENAVKVSAKTSPRDVLTKPKANTDAKEGRTLPASGEGRQVQGSARKKEGSDNVRPAPKELDANDRPSSSSGNQRTEEPKETVQSLQSQDVPQDKPQESSQDTPSDQTAQKEASQEGVPVMASASIPEAPVIQNTPDTLFAAELALAGVAQNSALANPEPPAPLTSQAEINPISDVKVATSATPLLATEAPLNGDQQATDLGSTLPEGQNFEALLGEKQDKKQPLTQTESKNDVPSALNPHEKHAKSAEDTLKGLQPNTAPLDKISSDPNQNQPVNNSSPLLQASLEKTGLQNPHIPAQSALHPDHANAQPATPLSQVPIEIGYKALSGAKRFEIRLDPPELGRVDVHLDMSDSGNVTARLTVERVETLTLLQRDARTLERAFEQIGLKAGEGGVTINLRDPNADGRREQQQNNSSSERGSSSGEARSRSPLTLEPVTPMKRYMWRGSSGVDMQV